DIVPLTAEARLFTLSVIVLGVAVFATSLTAVIAPLVGQSLQRIINRKGATMKRENHFVVIGNTPLAVNTWRELARRGRPVTRLLREAPEEGQLKDVDVVVGDPSMTEVLREAGADKAEAVLAMLADDSENAFCVLAVRELGSGVRTVAAVNDARHLSRVKLVQPDVVIAPLVSQSLQRIISRKGTSMKRENHFVVIGNTPLAVNTWRELARRGRPVTRVLREKPEEGQLKDDVDLVVGDPSMTETLKEAGADKAEAVLAMMADDSENAFCVLAVRELGSGTRTVAAVNDARHLSRVKLVQPDVVIAPQVLGGELTAMLLSGEQVTPEFVMQRVFQQNTSEP
ncbi:MAG TPA: NAD-binding protein, partial [Acidobacteriaceae bacterium]|nr:NAD-binding protein [Acidobacteriaceae bacterium]